MTVKGKSLRVLSPLERQRRRYFYAQDCHTHLQTENGSLAQEDQREVLNTAIDALDIIEDVIRLQQELAGTSENNPMHAVAKAFADEIDRALKGQRS